MNKQAFGILEFDSLRALVRRHAQTDLGRVRIDALEPIGDIELLKVDLRSMAELIELRHRGTRLQFDGIVDPSDSISRLGIEGTALDPLAMLDLARLCSRATDARTAIAAERDNCPT